jgi:cytochrome c553
MKHALLLTAACLALGVNPSALAQSGPAKPDLAKARQIVDTICAACHGADGNSPSPVNPSLAGQQAAYLTLQLTHFKTGVRSNPVMAGMAANLSPEDMAALAAYFSQQKPRGMAATDPALVPAGQNCFVAATLRPVSGCAACHAPNGVGIPSRYPRLSSQYAEYTYAQLKAFKAGERGMDKEGKDVNGRVMAQVAGKMSDQEMRAVADYAAGLH